MTNRALFQHYQALGPSVAARAKAAEVGPWMGREAVVIPPVPGNPMDAGRVGTACQAPDEPAGEVVDLEPHIARLGHAESQYSGLPEGIGLRR